MYTKRCPAVLEQLLRQPDLHHDPRLAVQRPAALPCTAFRSPATANRGDHRDERPVGRRSRSPVGSLGCRPPLPNHPGGHSRRASAISAIGCHRFWRSGRRRDAPLFDRDASFRRTVPSSAARTTTVCLVCCAATSERSPRALITRAFIRCRNHLTGVCIARSPAACNARHSLCVCEASLIVMMPGRDRV